MMAWFQFLTEARNLLFFFIDGFHQFFWFIYSFWFFIGFYDLIRGFFLDRCFPYLLSQKVGSSFFKAVDKESLSNTGFFMFSDFDLMENKFFVYFLVDKNKLAFHVHHYLAKFLLNHSLYRIPYKDYDDLFFHLLSKNNYYHEKLSTVSKTFAKNKISTLNVIGQMLHDFRVYAYFFEIFFSVLLKNSSLLFEHDRGKLHSLWTKFLAISTTLEFGQERAYPDFPFFLGTSLVFKFEVSSSYKDNFFRITGMDYSAWIDELDDLFFFSEEFGSAVGLVFKVSYEIQNYLLSFAFHEKTVF